jgi:hypothetical protein
MSKRGAAPGERRGGRAKGTLNRATREIRTIAQEYGPEIIQFFMKKVARNEKAPLEYRIVCGKEPVPEEGELFSPDRIGVKATAEDVFMWVRA